MRFYYGARRDAKTASRPIGILLPNLFMKLGRHSVKCKRENFSKSTEMIPKLFMICLLSVTESEWSYSTLKKYLESIDF